MQQKLQKASMRMSRIKKYILENKKDNYDPRDYEAALRQTDLGGEDTPSHIQAAQALALASKGLELSDEQQRALGPYVRLFSELLVNPRFRSRIHSMIRLINQDK